MADDKAEELRFKETFGTVGDPLQSMLNRCQKKVRKCDDLVRSNDMQQLSEREKMIKTNIQTDNLLKDIKEYLETIIQKKKGN